jgi:hypothetical protein
VIKVPTVGLEGQSATMDGVLGVSTSANGVEGSSTSGAGVYGSSKSGNGVTAISARTNGIYAKGKPAGLFAGDVTIDGKLSVKSALSAASLKTSGAVNAGSVTTSGKATVGSIKSSGEVSAGSIKTKGNVTANDVLLTGSDLAEDFFATMEAPMEPGTVVVINEKGVLGESSLAYDRRVAGVISGAGRFRPGIVMGRGGEEIRSGDRRVSVALVGKVYCKVDADYGPVDVGDLLTTSPTPGHAMKADDQNRAFGAVIGKAMASLDSGTSLVPILVALQ